MWKFLPFLLLATPALSDQNIGGKVVDCYCTDTSGARVELGQTICLQVDGRMFMAQCQMSLNVPMWREVAQGCLSSFLRQSVKPLVDAHGVDTEITAAKS
ncbi:hypothetical protein TG4357_00282 [Thalassovita gelatinovora]|uniref:Uncharacterized protein n=1 Tax=Thalassovita gelatinovora TaxID=53501 RepID=A0A0P1F4L5_THAGE|nr:hypothetical protein [Thalassovita gelatinovora]QIZ79411.1 hypothetical protein HFZ77_02445 [Thalassovita gelatinovora]CUH62753.1 hypothetical protein TG4357_00282 [Thalassovita gelatinovora]SEQ09562.1 hypothetical protein SAMN04488043_103182 [Thalassovita gelatinovora]